MRRELELRLRATGEEVPRFRPPGGAAKGCVLLFTQALPPLRAKSCRRAQTFGANARDALRSAAFQCPKRFTQQETLLYAA